LTLPSPVIQKFIDEFSLINGFDTFQLISIVIAANGAAVVPAKQNKTKQNKTKQNKSQHNTSHHNTLIICG
jgi:hypothetical protein